MIPVQKSNEPIAPYPKEQRRRDRRNYGVAFVVCILGIGFGHLIRRSGWGGDFGSLFGILAFILAIVCGVRWLLALKG